MRSLIHVSLVLFIGIQMNWASAKSPSSTELVISTLNMKWFGIGGFMWNTPDQEYRQEFMKQFIDEVLPNSGVIVFTEVVKTDTLKDVVKERMDCATYEGLWSRHQHIVICYDRKLYRTEKYDSDYIIEEVDLGSGGLRPAAQAKVCHLNGPCFLQVIGVHLAAGPKSEKRLSQVKFINENLVKHDKLLPTIVTGDFNSYITAQSGLPENDIDMFEKALSENTKAFKSVTRHITTYGSGDWARAYDHIISTSDIRTLETWGYEACKQKPDLSKTFIPYGSFRKYFTDHCPVSARIVVKH